MITTILVEYPWLSPAALAVLVTVGPVAGWWCAGRPRAAWWLAGLALLPVVVLTLTPTAREPFSRCELAWTVPTLGRVELAANVVLFVAPALFAAVASRRPFLVLVVGTASSATIETFQALVPALGRSCSTNDWMSNTIGVVIGAVLAVGVLTPARRHPARFEPQP